ncbi:WXG100 family type VII secretion target [Micromonospora sp. NPDC093277]|uniref:WXG100 family type VII secretion target n=1 Tax=Micromonospora sp. NPDC093277 TaxID=3364291 RepID=UPI00381AAFF7
MTNYMADIGGMGDVGTGLRQIYNSLVQSLHALEAAARNYSAANNGAAIDGYGAAQAEWNAGLNEFNNALTVAERSLGHIASGYVTTDERGAARFNG